MDEKISERFVNKLSAKFEKKKTSVIPAGQVNKVFFDKGPDALKGFGLRITDNGVKSFLLRYRHRGQERRMTIGQWPAWSALKARERAKELRRMVDSGIDPLGVKEEQREAPRMSVLFERYMKEYAPVYKKPRSVEDDRYALYGTYKGTSKQFTGLVGKHFAKMFVDEVTADDIRKFHLALQGTPTRANRALALLSKLFGLAEQWEYRKQNDNPAKGVRKYAEKARDRFLNGDELAKLGKALAESDEDPRAVAAIRLLLFTGMRVGELLGLKQSDVNMKDGVAHLAKAGGRDVQLPAPALAVLADLPKAKRGDSVIGLPYGPLHTAWQRICAKAEIEDVRIHDLRHTMGTYAGAAGFNTFLVKQLLGHKTLAMTDRYVGKHVDPLREASGRVADQLAAAMKGDSAEVVELAKRGT